MSVTTLLAISLGAILTNNFIFSQFLGICPFLGVSKKIDTAVGMGAAVTFVMGLASAFCYLVNLILVPLHLEFMQTVAFILVIRAAPEQGRHIAAALRLHLGQGGGRVRAGCQLSCGLPIGGGKAGGVVMVHPMEKHHRRHQHQQP